MSGVSEERDLLAAEYVLGTLEPAEARELVAARAKTDPALAHAIAAWEERLMPLSLSVAPVAPPASLWRRLSASIAPKPDRSWVRAWRSVAVWRGATAAGFALAAALAAFLFVRPPHPLQSVAALVPAGSAAAAYLAELQPDGTLRLVALRPVPVAAGKDLELWALPKGAARPVALGVLPASGRNVAPPQMPARGTQLLISLEPLGGSPTGLPTGPVLFAGTLQGAQ